MTPPRHGRSSRTVLTDVRIRQSPDTQQRSPERPTNNLVTTGSSTAPSKARSTRHKQPSRSLRRQRNCRGMKPPMTRSFLRPKLIICPSRCPTEAIFPARQRNRRREHEQRPQPPENRRPLPQSSRLQAHFLDTYIPESLTRTDQQPPRHCPKDPPTLPGKPPADHRGCLCDAAMCRQVFWAVFWCHVGSCWLIRRGVGAVWEGAGVKRTDRSCRLPKRTGRSPHTNSPGLTSDERSERTVRVVYRGEQAVHRTPVGEAEPDHSRSDTSPSPSRKKPAGSC